MSRRANPFRSSTVLILLLVGALAFLLLLYALGRGWTGDGGRDGGNHAAANGLNGFSGLAALLEATGTPVTLARNRGELDQYGLTILTPPLWADGGAIDDIVQKRVASGTGPTLLVLPKWVAMPVPEEVQGESQDGWVVLQSAMQPPWFEQISFAQGAGLAIGETRGWQGLGGAGDLPQPDQVQALVRQGETAMTAIIEDAEGDVLAARITPGGKSDPAFWPVVVVFEPDLLNNSGMADPRRAAAALALVETASGGENIPVRFDLTLNGLGAAENLLTLAFRSPFLAATLCMLLAALVIGWRALRRFGPPIAEAPARAMGKRQLASNGAALLQRVKRWHLLKSPYEDMIARRITTALGIRPGDPATRPEAIDRALARRGHDDPQYARLAEDLRSAERPADIVRAAQRLRTFERTLTQ